MGTSKTKCITRQDARQLREADHHVRRDLAEHEPHRLHRRDEELLQRPALALAHDGDRGEHARDHLEEHRDEPRDQVVGGARVRVEEHHRPRLELPAARPRARGEAAHRLRERHAARRAHRRRRDRGLRAVDEHQHLRRSRSAACGRGSRAGSPRRPWRGTRRPRRAPRSASCTGVRSKVPVARSVSRKRRLSTECDSSQHHRGDVPDVGVHPPVDHHLDHGHHQRHHQRHPVAADVRATPCRRRRGSSPTSVTLAPAAGLASSAARARSWAAARVSDTNTSSRDGAMVRTDSGACPRAREVAAEIVVGDARRDHRVHALPEDGRLAHVGQRAHGAQGRGHLAGLDLDAARALGVHRRERAQVVGAAGRHHLREVEVADLAAALGLVHVVRGDEQRDPLGRELEEQVPELAPRHRIDARGGLVEEDRRAARASAPPPARAAASSRRRAARTRRSTYGPDVR